MNPLHSHLICVWSIPHLRLGLCSALFPSSLPIITSCISLFPSRAICSVHLSLLHLISVSPGSLKQTKKEAIFCIAIYVSISHSPALAGTDFPHQLCYESLTHNWTNYNSIDTPITVNTRNQQHCRRTIAAHSREECWKSNVTNVDGSVGTFRQFKYLWCYLSARRCIASIWKRRQWGIFVKNRRTGGRVDAMAEVMVSGDRGNSRIALGVRAASSLHVVLLLRKFIWPIITSHFT
jgi:hypothetical protein